MSAGFLPVSLGMLPGLFFGAVVRRVRRAALVLAPTGEWGTDLRSDDFAGLTAVAVAVAVLAGLGFAWCVWKLYRMRDEVELADESFSVEEHVESPVTRRSGSEDDR